MKLLVVSHNVFSDTESMGRTLSSYFRGCKEMEIAQFYIHSEVPTTTEVCDRYFRITDMEALKSIITRKCGSQFDHTKIFCDRLTPRTDTGAVAAVYQKGRKRTPLIYLARNMIWGLSNWNNKKFQSWLSDFAPDAVFFASGDYSFLYRIALKIAQKRNIPLYTCCMDDYYFINKNEKVFLGKLSHRLFMRQVKRTLSYSSGAFCICDAMNRDYEKAYGLRCYTLHTSTMLSEPIQAPKTEKLSYLGNLGYNRHMQLVEMGRALKALNMPNGPHWIDVYSSEPREEILKELTEENGIRFHGQIPYEEVKKVMGESLAVIHTESFEQEIADVVRYSVSTKIADSLASGTCMLAYGPEDVASIAYLKENHAAVCITSPKELKDGLTALLTSEELRTEIVANALKLASENHRPDKNSQMIYRVLKQNQ